MKKTITITDDMDTPLHLALNAGKRFIEELRQYAADSGDDDMVLRYEKDIQAMDQVLEKLRRAKWRA